MPDYDQGYQVGAKMGTVFLGIGPDFADLALDLSQDPVDMTANAASVSEDPANRYNVSHPRTIAARVQVDNATTGTLYHQGVTGQETALVADGAGGFDAVVDGAVVGSITMPNVAGSRRTYEVAWVSVASPDTSLGDVASWLLAWDVSAVEAARVGPFFHDAKPDDDGECRWGEDEGGGAAYSDVIERVSFHRRAMTLAEIHNDWISQASPPTVDGEVRREALPFDLASGIGDRNELQGPPGAWAARAHRQLRRRTVTGRSIDLAGEVLSAAHATGNPMTRLAVGSTVYRLREGWIWALPVPPTVSHLWVRVHADSWVTAGAAVPLGIRVYSANKPPQLAVPIVDEPYDQRFATSVVTRDDGGAGAGAWSFAEAVQIVRGTVGQRRGWTYIMLAYAFDPEGASANDVNARAAFNSIVFAPHYQVPGAGQPVVGGESG